MSTLRTSVAVAILVLLSSGASATSRSFRPDFTFSGSSLAGFQAVGKAEWRAEDGDIVGTAPLGGGGWLMFDKSFQDVAFFAAFRCTGTCRTGVLLRAESIPAGGLTGLYVSLTEGDLAVYRVTLDATGRELTREPLKFGRGAGRTDLAPARAGGPATSEELFTVDLRADWNTIQILLDVNLLRPYLNDDKTRSLFEAFLTSGNTAAVDYGRLALHVGGGGEVRFRTVSYKDLQAKTMPREAMTDRFTRQQLSGFFYSYSPAVADIDRDGVPDVVAGPYYYLGPDYTVSREIYLPQSFNPSSAGPDARVMLAHDFTGDGWPDVVSVGLPGADALMYVNPRGESRRWSKYPVLRKVTSEGALLADVDGDGNPEAVFVSDGVMGYAKPDPANPTAHWIFRAVSEGVRGSAHGLGVGDVSGDGRADILHADGWWEQPAAGAAGPWTYHADRFGDRGGGAQMAVYDVNGDGRNDVVTSLAGHGIGLAWFEQRRAADGKISFVQHMIMDDFDTTNAGGVTFAVLHASIAADVDRDGVPDFIVGKRYWSHREGYTDPDPYGPAVLYVYRTVRNASSPGGAEFVPELIHNRSGVGSRIDALDLNRDGAVDIVTSAIHGTFIFWGNPGPKRGTAAAIPPDRQQ